jgi:hypothetical protein
MESLSRVLLLSVESYETKHGSGPTGPELAADLRIPEDYGHHRLVERLKRQIALGRVTHDAGRFRFTEAGRAAVADKAAAEPSLTSEAATSADGLTPEPISTTS